ncbi:MAG: methylated-DNA--[Synergistaceae bacterium]|nr:methylated-DNA--[protein]-cysteine S-methyltransferase [Synergistaceae bacterium]
DYKALPIFDDAKHWLDIYFSGQAPDFTPKLKIPGSEFQKLVYEIVLTIPFGDVMTYSEIAEVIAEKRGLASMSPQAVGGAVGCNSIPLIIPCHRVIGKNGKLVGYFGGIDRKKKLLMLEGVDMSKLSV